MSTVQDVTMRRQDHLMMLLLTIMNDYIADDNNINILIIHLNCVQSMIDVITMMPIGNVLFIALCMVHNYDYDDRSSMISMFS